MVFNIRDSKTRRVKTDYPYEVEKMENVWIPMSDGAKLSASIWLPKGANENPVPAILEYLPYRKNDFTAIRDSVRHPYFAGHGYASIRVDIRGAGDSDGILLDEYLKQEQDDALDVLSWIEEQKWSTGSVGMIGKSWGGFNGLQVAARNHRALKTIITLCSTDDRYSDDVHYRGGNVLASDMLWWASTMFAYSARPQDPAVVGEGWKENWLERLETPPYVEEWLTHQRRDSYWKHGSVCEDFSDIKIPVFAVSGWQDGYTDSVFRILEHVEVSKGLIGPWAHEYPEVATPEPAIGFLQECLRWWDQWLKGKDTGIMDEPKLVSYIQDSERPAVMYDERPGKWVADEAWPTSSVQGKSWWISGSKLVHNKQDVRRNEVLVPSVQEHGFYSGVFCPFGQPGDLPADQRLENGKAVVFTSEPLEETIELLGHPVFHAELKSDQPDALIAVRLMDKAPTGESTLISWGMLNLTHRNSHEFPEKLVPGATYKVSVQLDSLGQQIPKGHRLEVAVSPTYWPAAWPSPKPVSLTLNSGFTRLELPVRTPQPADSECGKFDAPETAPVMDREIIRKEKRTRDVIHDPINGIWTIADFSDEGERRLPVNGIHYGSKNKNTFVIKENDPLSARVICEWELSVGRGEDWDTKLDTYSEMWSDETTFFLENRMTAYEKGEQIFTRTWKKEIPRDHV